MGGPVCGNSCCKQRDNNNNRPIPLSVTPPKTTIINNEKNPIVTIPEITNNLKEFQPNESKIDENKIRLRQEIRALTKEQLIEVQYAFHLLQNTNNDDGSNKFFRLARLHTLYCMHWQYHFIHWHRRYLDEFEEELRQVYFNNVKDNDPLYYKNLSLPYWSWASVEDNITDQFDIPKIFMEDTFKRNGETFPNSLKSFTYAQSDAVPNGQGEKYSNELKPSYIQPDPDIKYKIENNVLPELVETMRNEVAFMNEQGVGRIKNQEWTQFNGKTFKYLETGFAFHLEVTAGHNSLHMLCRGDMGHPWFAAFCPIFWFHHNNIERLGRIWSENHVAMRYPDEFYNKDTGLLPGLKPRPNSKEKFAYIEEELRPKDEYNFTYQPKEWNLFFAPRPKSARQFTRHRLCFTDLQLYDAPYSFHTYLFLDGEQIPKKYPGVPHPRYLTSTDVFQRPCLCSEEQKSLKLSLPSFTDVSHQIRTIIGEVPEIPQSAKLITYAQDMNGNEPEYFIVKNGGKIGFLISKPFITSLRADRTVKLAPTFKRNITQINNNDDSKELSVPGWNVSRLHEKYGKGNNVRIGIIDTGIDSSLCEKLQLSNEQLHDFTFSDTDDQFRMLDSDGHGTFGTSIISTIAPEAKLYCAKSLTTESGSWKSVIKGIRWAINEGVHILCLALGSDYSNGPLSDIIHEAISAGIIVIAAAGNDQDGIDFPGRYGSVICIGACDQDSKPAPISSIGPELDFLCPGKDIIGYHFGNSRIQMTGSSVATAHACGLAALLVARENGNNLDFGQRSKWRIKNNTDLKEVFKTLTDGNFNINTGFGAIKPDR